MKKQFQEMHNRMQGHMDQQQGYQQTSTPKPEDIKENAGDYIDFEELK